MRRRWLGNSREILLLRLPFCTYSKTR
uniref:Uncharacterized protein n=1 Tax=Arundo donax TaxID=35708 RepID=A0A0A9GUV6_ARUDO